MKTFFSIALNLICAFSVLAQRNVVTQPAPATTGVTIIIPYDGDPTHFLNGVGAFVPVSGGGNNSTNAVLPGKGVAINTNGAQYTVTVQMNGAGDTQVTTNGNFITISSTNTALVAGDGILIVTNGNIRTIIASIIAGANVSIGTNGSGQLVIASSGGGGGASQTPITQDVDWGGFNANNMGSLTISNRFIGTNYGTGNSIVWDGTNLYLFGGTNVAWYDTIHATNTITADQGFFGNAAGLTNLYDTNIVGTITTLTVQSNTVTLNNGEFLLVSAGPTSFTNIAGILAGYRRTALIATSNSAATSMTNYSTIPNARYVQGSTNILAVPAGKMAQWFIEVWSDKFTNVWNALIAYP